MNRRRGAILYINLFLGLFLLGISVAPTVCLAESLAGSEQILAEKVAGSEIALGDEIVILSPSEEMALSSNCNGNKIVPADVTLRNTSTREVITEMAADTAILEVVDMGEGYIGLKCDEGYLTSADTGNGLFYAADTSDCSKWQIEEEVFLHNIGAAYNNVYNQYLEYYGSSFTTYGKKSTSSPEAFTLSFYRMGNSNPEEEILTEDNYSLPLIETSDIHGYLADTSGEDPLYLLAYISDKVNDIRGSDDETGREKLVLLDGGDIYQGNTLSNLLYGNPMSAAFQIMGYDAVTIGNHEFDWGIENMIDEDHTMMDYTIGSESGINSVPNIICNLYKNGEKFSRADGYIILEKKAVNGEGKEIPVRIGVIGYAGEYSSSIMYAMFKGVGYSIDTNLMKVNALAQRLEKIDRCDATVLLAHEHAPTVVEGLDENSVIDLVLGGHLHTSVKAQTDWGLSYFEPAGLGQAYVYAELDFALENGSPVFKKVGNSKVVNVVSDTSRLTNTSENEDELDPEIVSLTNEVISELDEVLKKQIGYITEPASRDALPGGDGRSSAMSNWMASVIARATGADIGFVNSGGVRTEFAIEDGSDKRNITKSDVYTAFPFGNLLYCFKLTYEDLLKVFQYSLTDGGTRLVSNMVGINYYYSDQTVQAIVTTDGQEVYVNGTWKDGWKDRTILVAVNEYTATNDRVSSDGMHNPFVTWKDDETKLVDKTRVDNESAIEVLTKEAEANGGLLSVDTNVYTKCEEYTPQPEDDPDDEDEPVVPSTVQMWRLYNPNSGEHFYTASTGERDLLVKAGWQNEGKAWVAPKTSSEPVWRLYNKNGGDHHYTTSAGERDLLIAAGWQAEGVGWYSDTAKRVPVYRVYNPNAATGSHHFTTSAGEVGLLVAARWNDEGIGFYGVR